MNRKPKFPRNIEIEEGIFSKFECFLYPSIFGITIILSILIKAGIFK